MSGITLLDGIEYAGFESLQRGLAYGDGVFETMRASAGIIALWPGHSARLAQGCARLGIDVPEVELLVEERNRLLRGQPDSVVKLMLWRRASGAGYDPARERGSHRCWTTSRPTISNQRPLRVRWCDLQLARQPRLAGLKTLNRLEQVLARGEWVGSEWDEGLLCDSAGQVVSAVSGNLFAVIDGRLSTPALDHCGVAGVLRAWVLDQAQPTAPIDVRAILRAELERASELFVTNAVRGICAIGTLESRDYFVGPATNEWIARARAAGVMGREEQVR